MLLSDQNIDIGHYFCNTGHLMCFPNNVILCLSFLSMLKAFLFRPFLWGKNACFLFFRLPQQDHEILRVLYVKAIIWSHFRVSITWLLFLSFFLQSSLFWIRSQEVLNVASLAGETVKKPVNVVLYFISTDQNWKDPFPESKEPRMSSKIRQLKLEQ